MTLRDEKATDTAANLTPGPATADMESALKRGLEQAVRIRRLEERVERGRRAAERMEIGERLRDELFGALADCEGMARERLARARQAVAARRREMAAAAHDLDGDIMRREAELKLLELMPRPTTPGDLEKVELTLERNRQELAKKRAELVRLEAVADEVAESELAAAAQHFVELGRQHLALLDWQPLWLDQHRSMGISAAEVLPKLRDELARTIQQATSTPSGRNGGPR